MRGSDDSDLSDADDSDVLDADDSDVSDADDSDLSDSDPSAKQWHLIARAVPTVRDIPSPVPGEGRVRAFLSDVGGVRGLCWGLPLVVTSGRRP